MPQDVPKRSPEVIEIGKRRIAYPSSAGNIDINAIAWEPVFADEEQRPLGIVQIVHGMVEHIDRYDWYARQLAARGYVVAGNDHVGHGSSIKAEEDWGYIPMQDGDKILVEDVERLRHLMQGDYDEEVPYFIHGHSMGSFVTRLYITRYAKGLSGAIIEGTGNHPAALYAFGRALTTMGSKLKGDRYRSKLVDKLAFGGYNKSVSNPRTSRDWLTRDAVEVDKYSADPRCTFVFTLAGYHTLLTMAGKSVNQRYIAKVPRSLPILVISGDADPVGGKKGVGPTRAAKAFKTAGVEDVTLKLYKDARHELHNENNKEEFTADVLGWLENHLHSKVMG